MDKAVAILVAAAVIERDGRFLVAQRKEGGGEPLKWEFPGGKVERGESPEECLRREIGEELGLDIAVGGQICTSPGWSRGSEIMLLAYRASIISGEPRAIDVKDWRWAGKEELPSFDWADADRAVVRHLLRSP
jgi:8-oxo-dGTP diphosphatase